MSVSNKILNIPLTKVFKMAILNVGSLLKHLDETRLLLDTRKLNVLALNETLLDFSIPDELVNIDGYGLIRVDRKRNEGGVSGVLHLGITDHNLIYAIRQINAKPANESQTYNKNRDFKKLGSSNFLNDLYEILGLI